MLALLLGEATGFSQSITSLQSLRQKKQSEFEIREARVSDFLKSHDVPMAINTLEGRHMLMVDVVDGVPVYVATLNSDAAITTGVSQIQSGGVTGLNLEGEELLIGVWDEGSVKDHIELGTRVISKEVDNAVNHATHVTGTIIAAGVNPDARGMAPKATVTNWYFNNDLAEMAALAKPDEHSLLLSNHSYGTVTGWTKINGQWNWSGNASISSDEDYRFGFYGDKAAALDELANLAPYYTIVWAAGNDRGEPGDGSRPPDCNGGTGYDCIIPESVAKNIITVGAINKMLTYTDPTNAVMSSFSSWGPTDDGRIKPDLVGAGVNIFSLSADGVDTYSFSSGTSMATPNVTGSLALLQELYRKLHGGKIMEASTLKALAIHTAKEAGSSPGPDYQFGWGVLDVQAAAQLLVNEDGINVIVSEKKLMNGATQEIVLNPMAGQKITATIVWNDPVAQPLNPALDPISLMLVNDLDVKLIAEDGSVKYPWLLDPSVPSAQATKGDNYRDNVEKLEFNLPEGNPYRLVVSHKGQLLNGSQDYSLVLKYQSSTPNVKTLYWVGDTGDWNDGSHWSFSSGGAPAMVIPDVSDRIIIDENSFDGVGVDQILLSQNNSVGTIKWLRSIPAELDLQGHALTVTKELVLASDSFQSIGDGDIICSAPAGSGNLYFSNNELGNLKLIIDGGGWTMYGTLGVDHLDLQSGKLFLNNSELTLNELNSTNATQARELVITDTKVKLNEQSNFDVNQFTLESNGSKIIFDNTNAELNWDGVSFNGALEIIGSEVNVNGDIEIAELSVYAGSNLTFADGSMFHTDTISWLMGEESKMVNISSTGKSSMSIGSHFLLCSDYLNISNVDLVGTSRIYTGLNSSVTNALNWQLQTCSSALFADFDVLYLCQNGFTEFVNKSTGSINKYEWSFGNTDGVIGQSIFENAFQSFENAGVYTVTLTVSNESTSHSYQRQIEVLPSSFGKNDIAVNANELVSLATSSSYQWFLNEQKIEGAMSRSYPYLGAEGVYRVVTFDGSCNRSSNLVTITGLDNELHEFSVYPNPVQSDLSIEINSPFPAQAIIFDLLGRVWSTTTFTASANIPLNSLSNGIYILKVKTTEREMTRKVIVRR
ncbi:MAG: S8 family serine peptidase [Cyclobacteriaceae bacterium]